jgi:hypothetical protein
VRYENVLVDSAKELTELSRVLGIEPTVARFERFVRLSSDSTCRLSRRNSRKNEWPRSALARTFPLYARPSQAGGAISYRRGVKTIQQFWRATMKELGYDLVMDADACRGLVKR